MKSRVKSLRRKKREENSEHLTVHDLFLEFSPDRTGARAHTHTHKHLISRGAGRVCGVLI